jgi:hypothetical protein
MIAAGFECDIVNAARRLADCTAEGSALPAQALPGAFNAAAPRLSWLA